LRGKGIDFPSEETDMRANAFVTAALTAGFALAPAGQAGAQREVADPARVEVPSSGLVLDFHQIDLNKDGSISVQEWNAFVASVRR
jgi:hypothetical protein